jgi:hypothetical protein
MIYFGRRTLSALRRISSRTFASRREWFTFDIRRAWIFGRTDVVPFAAQMILLTAVVMWCYSEWADIATGLPPHRIRIAEGLIAGLTAGMLSGFVFSLWNLHLKYSTERKKRAQKAASLWLRFVSAASCQPHCDDDALLELEIFLAADGRLPADVVFRELAHLRSTGAIGPEGRRALEAFMPTRMQIYGRRLRAEGARDHGGHPGSTPCRCTAAAQSAIGRVP